MVSASLENVENVVKPPHSPTVRNRPQDVVSVALRLSSPHSRPIIRHPARFTARVAHGNGTPLPIPFIASDTRYLAIPPMKLPAPTANMFLMNSMLVLVFREDSIPYSLGERGNSALVRLAGKDQQLDFDVADLVIVDCVWVV